MRVFDNSVNTLQQQTFTYERLVQYRNGDPYVIPAGYNNPYIVFSLGSSKYEKNVKLFKSWWGLVDDLFPRFEVVEPEVLTEEPLDKGVYFPEGWDRENSNRLFKWNGEDTLELTKGEYFYYTRELALGEANNRPYIRLNYWTDGENHYLSEDRSLEYDDDEDHYEHYVLDENGAWIPKVWNGYTAFGGQNIWNYKGETYCSAGTSQFVLNKSTSTWEPKVWNSLPQNGFSGSVIWIDEVEDKVYMSKSSNDYVLDEDTDTWESMDWGEIKPGSTFGVWHHGENYYSNRYISVNGQTQTQDLVLNRSTHTWEEKIWNVPSNLDHSPIIRASNIWCKGEDCYYSDLWGNNFILDENTDTWSEKIWNGLPLKRFDGHEIVTMDGKPYLSAENIWHWNGKTYYSASAVQYVLNEETDIWEPYRWPTTYISGYTYTEVPYEFRYIRVFSYDDLEKLQGFNYVYDIKVVSGETNYEALVELLHFYGIDQQTWEIKSEDVTYTFALDENGVWRYNGDIPSFGVLKEFAKSDVVKEFVLAEGEEELKQYREYLKAIKADHFILRPENVDFILKPTPFNISSIVKGRVHEN